MDRMEFECIAWEDPRGRQAVGGDVLALIISEDRARARSGSTKRGRVSANAARWFTNRNVDRVRLVVSRDRHYVALQAHASGSMLRAEGTSTRRMGAGGYVTVPGFVDVGLIELEPFGDMLVGSVPNGAKPQSAQT